MVGKNIKKYRKQKGITQKELAEQCSYSENFIGNLENNTFKTCSLNTLYYISKKLGIHMKDYLMNRWRHKKIRVMKTK